MPYGLIPLLIGLLNLFLGIFVLSRDASRETNRTFCYWMITSSLWNFMDFGMDVIPREDYALAWTSFLAGSIAFIPSTFFHFVLAFILDQNLLNRRLSKLGYGVSFILLAFTWTGYLVAEIREIAGYGGFHYPVGKAPTYQFLMFFFYSFTLYGAYLLFRRFRWSQSSLVRNSLKYLLIGLAIAIVGGVTNFLLASGTIQIFPLGHITNGIFCVMVAYAIVRYHLMDVNLIIRRGLVYSLMTGAISGVFFFSLVMFERMLFAVPASGRTLLSGVTTALFIAIVFQPLREMLQVRIDRAFLREGYNKRLVLETLRKRIADSIDRRELLSITLGTLMEVFPIERVIIFLHRGDEGGYGVSLSIGLDHLKRRSIHFREDAVLIRFLRETKHGILRAEAEENPEIDSGLVRDFDTLGVELCIPIVYGEELLGILALGRKSFNRLYSVEEIEILTDLGEKIGLGVENTKLVEETRRRFIATILSLLKAIGARDAYTWRHCENVSEYAARVADRLGLSYELVEAIRIGGLLHDIGKIGINDHILLKPDKLNEEEFDIIKRHPSIGSQILKPVGLHPMTHDGVLHHHESINGNGYPDGLSGEEFTLAAKILAVVDNYDAMTTDRPYRSAMKKEEAIKELKKGRGQRFDEGVVKTFLSILEEEEQGGRGDEEA